MGSGIPSHPHVALCEAAAVVGASLSSADSARPRAPRRETPSDPALTRPLWVDVPMNISAVPMYVSAAQAVAGCIGSGVYAAAAECIVVYAAACNAVVDGYEAEQDLL